VKRIKRFGSGSKIQGLESVDGNPKRLAQYSCFPSEQPTRFRKIVPKEELL
jgi:hypothetical protein